MGEISPTEETLMRMISEARNKQPSELDQPWSIGACAQYNIPPDIIPVLIKIQQFRARSEFKILQQELTIREARWFARLHPVVETLTRKQFPYDPEARLRFLSLIVSCYVQRERVSELMNEQYPDTSELDRIYFVNEDLSSNALFEAWWSTRSEQEQISVSRSIHRLRDGSFIFQQPKSAKGRRTVALSPVATQVLSEYREKTATERLLEGNPLKDNDLVFSKMDGSPIRPNTISRAWSDLAKRCGISASRLHNARHSHASIMLKAGIHPRIVQERLGHSTIAITLDTYSHVSPGLQEAAAKRFDDALLLRHNEYVNK